MERRKATRETTGGHGASRLISDLPPAPVPPPIQCRELDFETTRRDKMHPIEEQLRLNKPTNHSMKIVSRLSHQRAKACDGDEVP